ncbi:MAG: alpha/beta hydrolase family protein [Saprospiraceae bacterium]
MILKRLFLAFFILLFLLPQINFAQNGNITGDWFGTLDVQGVMELRIVFHIAEKDGQLTSTLDSPDQNANGLPVAETRFEAPELTLSMPMLQAEYKGTVNDDFTELTGTFTQRGIAMPLTMGRTAVEKAEVNRPQEPKPPVPYYVEEVTFENVAAGITLAGTLTLPEKEGHFPVAVLVSGSGPQDRNEELLGHKPFLVLADYLTRQGIGVLRFDDRGVGKSTGNFGPATSEDFATDALAAVEYLKTRPEANPGQIGIIGHSEGGMIAPMVAAQSDDVAFIVLLAGPGVIGKDLLLRQIKLISLANGEDEDKVEKGDTYNQEIFDIICLISDTTELRTILTEVMKRQISEQPEEDKKGIGDPDEYIKSQLAQIMTPWFRFFLCYDPVPALEKVSCPVLALNGGKDLQVDPKQNLGGIEAALKKAGNPNFKVKKLEGLNHLFQTCETGAPSEYSKIEETFSPVALKEVADWILSALK